MDDDVRNAPFALLAMAGILLSGCTQGNPPEDPGLTQGLRLSSHRDGVPVDLPAEFDQGLVIALQSTGYMGGEPNIGITSSGSIFVTAEPITLRSTDHGRTWTESFNLTAFWGPASESPIKVPGVEDPVSQVTRTSDPMLWVDADTDRIFTAHMTDLYCAKMFFSDDDGDSWSANPVYCGIPVNDHPKVATARPGPDGSRIDNPVYPNVVYYCYGKLVATHCAVSLNGGLTVSYDRPASLGVESGTGGVPETTAPCGGTSGHPAPAPDGTLYVPVVLGCAGPVVLVTTDNGLTWTARQGPTVHGTATDLDPDITVTPDGTAYMLYRGGDQLQYLVRSSDRFATFEGPWLVSPPGIQSTAFSVLTSGDDGRIALAYLGTQDTKREPSYAENTTRWHLYQAFSFDADAPSPTFTTMQVTPDGSPVQIGCIWMYGTHTPCRNLLDFIDLARTPDGRPVVVFSDGCALDCDGNAAATDEDSRSRLVTLAVMESGPSLFHSQGQLGPTQGTPGRP